MNGQENTRRPQTPGEEIANAILHGLGAILATAGLTLLVLRAGGKLGGKGGGAREPVSLTVFAASMILMSLFRIFPV
jgi:hemolysin III